MVPDFPEDSLVNFGGVQSPPMYIISSEGNSAMRSTATATARQHMVLLCEVVNPRLSSLSRRSSRGITPHSGFPQRHDTSDPQWRLGVPHHL